MSMARAAQPPKHLTKVGDFTIPNFQFRSGEKLPELRLHYITLGAPQQDAHSRTTNAVLILHGTGGDGHQFLRPQFADVLFKPGALLDPAKYFIILPDGIGHGKSSKPSDGLHARFPHYDYDDMVAAQHALLTQGLHVNHLRLVMGNSMGNGRGTGIGSGNGSGLGPGSGGNYGGGLTSSGDVVSVSGFGTVATVKTSTGTSDFLATVDTLSDGRLVAGVGVGWMREEFEPLNAPPVARRGAVTDEYLAAFRALWTEEAPSFQGEHVRFDNVTFRPKLVQKRIPLWVGGESQAALRCTARLGDCWYPASHNQDAPFDTPARQAFVSEMVEDRAHLPNAIALNSSMVNGSRIIGPSIGGVLIAGFGEAWCFTIDAISYVAVIASLIAMRVVPRERHREMEMHILEELRHGWNYVIRSVPIRSALLLVAIVSMAGTPYTVLMTCCSKT